VIVKHLRFVRKSTDELFMGSMIHDVWSLEKAPVFLLDGNTATTTEEAMNKLFLAMERSGVLASQQARLRDGQKSGLKRQ